jgi:hypothetical protein
VQETLCATMNTSRARPHLDPPTGGSCGHRATKGRTRGRGGNVFHLPPRARLGIAQPGACATDTQRRCIQHAHERCRHVISRGTYKRLYMPTSSAYDVNVATIVVAHSPPSLLQLVRGQVNGFVHLTRTLKVRVRVEAVRCRRPFTISRLTKVLFFRFGIGCPRGSCLFRGPRRNRRGERPTDAWEACA